ncbi:hypothetical protein KKF86_06300 [bacterium]|nr:hypothetical protein [bacterium]
MKKMTMTILAVAVFCFMLSACKDDNSDNDANDDATCQMTAEINNADFCGTGNFAHDPAARVLTMQAVNATTMETIQITVSNAGVGTFSFDMGDNFGGYTIDELTYFTISGAIVITKLDNEYVEGTFDFVGQLFGGGETKNVTNGVFKIPNMI